MGDDRLLTDADVQAIADAVACKSPACPNGLAPDDSRELVALAKFIRKAKDIIGTTIIYGAIGLLLAWLGFREFGGGK